ncbi:MAG: cytidine deaminase [Lachnospiraceae bacterium]|nr:cytidine deaminase [Lachnospiraceae bacterium]
MEEKYIRLINKAFEIRKKAYSPYSGYKVGAALLCGNGQMYLGCNIENSAFGPSICAERTAFVEAVKNGERDFDAIAIVTGHDNSDVYEMASPCGVCRQFMSEFCDDGFKIIMTKMDKEGNLLDSKILNMNEILPDRFKLKN